MKKMRNRGETYGPSHADNCDLRRRAVCAAVGYLLFVAVNALRKRFGKHGNVIEIDDDTLVVDLREYRRKKRRP